MSVTYLYPVGTGLNYLRNACAFHGDSVITKTPGAQDTVRQQATVSMWIRRSQLDTAKQYTVFHAGADANNCTEFYFEASGPSTFCVKVVDGGTAVVDLVTTGNDLNSLWSHYMVHFDLANATQNQRVRVFKNGVEAAFVTLNVPANQTTKHVGLLATETHRIGSGIATNFFEGLIADVIIADRLLIDLGAVVEGTGSANTWVNYGSELGQYGSRLRFDKPGNLGLSDQ